MSCPCSVFLVSSFITLSYEPWAPALLRCLQLQECLMLFPSPLTLTYHVCSCREFFKEVRASLPLENMCQAELRALTFVHPRYLEIYFFITYPMLWNFTCFPSTKLGAPGGKLGVTQYRHSTNVCEMEDLVIRNTT